MEEFAHYLDHLVLADDSGQAWRGLRHEDLPLNFEVG